MTPTEYRVLAGYCRALDACTAAERTPGISSIEYAAHRERKHMLLTQLWGALEAFIADAERWPEVIAEVRTAAVEP